MYCPICGRKIPENAHFCPNCGNSIDLFTESLEQPEKEDFIDDMPPAKPQNESTSSEDIQCPKCGSHNCEIQLQQTTTSKGNSYNAGMGCLGFLLTGPFGLLCGLCGAGNTVTTTHQSMCFCKHCGHQFLPKGIAKDNVKRSISLILGIIGAAVGFGVSIPVLLKVDLETGFICAIAFSVLFACPALILPLVSMSTVLKSFECKSPKELLGDEEYSNCIKRKAPSSMIIGAFVGLMLGALFTSFI